MEKAIENSDAQGTEIRTVQKEDSQHTEIPTNQNNLELKTLDMDAITVPEHHLRSDLGNLEGLQGSLKRDGLQDPLLVYETEAGKFGIIDGARRLHAVKEMGWKQILCLIKKGISQKEAAHLSYVRNKERKTLGVMEVARHIRKMKDTFEYTVRELELMGYGSPSAISLKLKLLALPEAIQKDIQEGSLTAEHGRYIAKLPTKAIQERMAKRIKDNDLTAKKAEAHIKRFLNKAKKETLPKIQVPKSEIYGVYFKDARNMSELPDKSVHLIVTSPPYNVGMEFEKGVTHDEHWENIFGVMNECARVLVDGGVMALNVGDIHHFKGKNGKNEFSQIQLVGHRYQTILRRHKVYLTDLVTWVKSNGSFSQDRSRAWSDKTEHTNYRILISQDPVYIFRKAGKREQPSSEKTVLRSRLTKEEWSRWANGIWNIPRVKAMDGHPAIYPDELVHRLVKMFSYEGDTVLDPFLGSGTTFKVAQELGRVPIGYERELQYKSVIMGKLEKSRQEAMEGLGRLAGGKKESPEQKSQAEPQAQAFRREENTAFPDMMSKAMGKSLSDKLCKPAQVAKESSDQPEEQRI